MDAAAKQHISANIGEDRIDALTKVEFLCRRVVCSYSVLLLGTSTMGC